ncbi:MAG: hypothetical protein QOJ59_1841 [Thermomicrobiales bacterium]|jgi:hypothetical protein|nr:hypothetical protein [Thermomicrobiales bacterium]
MQRGGHILEVRIPNHRCTRLAVPLVKRRDGRRAVRHGTDTSPSAGAGLSAHAAFRIIGTYQVADTKGDALLPQVPFR